MKTKTHSRYPGIRAFEPDEQHLFFGRREESKRLYSQIKTQNLVILFAKSGIGKSSLINASILPRLNQDAFFPIKVRFQNAEDSPAEILKSALSPHIDQALLAKYLPKGKSANIWESLRACRFEQNGKTLTPIIILDQFEEFFDHTLEQQNELAVELGDLVSHRLPNRIQDHLRSIPFTERTNEDLFWHSPIPVKILVAIRSDRIGFLDNLSTEIPGILQNRFQLKPLNKKSAHQAIVEPASLESANYTTLPFRYDPPVLEKILAGLSNSKGEIESFQLQLLCQYIEKQLLAESKGQQSTLITEDFFENEKGFEAALNAILNNYYENELAPLPEEERLKARRFIEEGLIINGRRAGLTEGVEKERYQVDKTLLSKLLESRLIRQENTHLGRSYEISHDTLVEPILASYEKRRFQEEEVKKAIAQRKERKRLMSAMALALLGFSLAAISLVFYLQANQAKEMALVEEAKAQKALTQFQEQRIESIEERYNRYLSKGENYTLQNDFTEATDAYETALQILQDFAKEVNQPDIIQRIDDGGKKARELIKLMQAKENLQSQFTQLIDEGEAFEVQGKFHFVNAKNKYAEALKLDYDNALAQSKLYQISGKLEVAFIDFSKVGDTFFKAQGYNFALEHYQEALRIKPGNISLRQKIGQCKALING